MKSYKKNLLDAVPEEGSGAFAELLKDSDSKVLRDTLMLLTKDNTESGKIIYLKKCSEPEEEVRKIYQALNYKDRPFWQKKSVLPEKGSP